MELKVNDTIRGGVINFVAHDNRNILETFQDSVLTNKFFI